METSSIAEDGISEDESLDWWSTAQRSSGEEDDVAADDDGFHPHHEDVSGSGGSPFSPLRVPLGQLPHVTVTEEGMRKVRI
mmetsp:Transcript_12755/g.25880  ORF Transcript_12755/g.25880 Transcript_12755/m.25880 type:complete len:81 (+) Transcript_12755:313-555(+)